jgi:predicted ATPase/DNA-binding SARP family transcriptional activator
VEGTVRGLEIRILGPLEIVVAGKVLEISSAKQGALLVAFALEPGKVVSNDRLEDALWGENPPESAQTTLRSLVYRLRRALARDTGGDAVQWLSGRSSGYLLDIEPDGVDFVRFDHLTAAGREALARTEPAVAAEALRRSLDLWRGPALGEFGSWPYFCAQARRLEEARLGAIEDLAEAELAIGRSGDALARLEAHVEASPLRERAWGHLMLALYRLGRQADALRAYQRVRQILAEELGIEPTPALRDLEAGILWHRPDLLLPGDEPTAGRPAAPAPRGFGDTVAFLFTDIESSTQHWEGDQDAMATDLARHDKLLSEACESWGGRVFSHTGDGMCAAFPTAAAAIGAAITGQSTVGQEHWGWQPLRVRMSVHAGAAECRAGNYFGPTLNRAARLLASAWGGQIVCSAAAADLAADHLPDMVTVLDLGEQRLADLARPEQVFQVAHPGLPADFPPLRTTSAIRHNLPAALTSFVGREKELGDVVRHLEQSRLVTLVGPGGAGKTRLALEAAASGLARFPDGVWLAELAPVRDPTLVAHTVATAIGLDPSGLTWSGRSIDEALGDQLRHRRLLVIFDNCEHLIAAAASLAHAIMSRCPDVTALTTSREVLGLPGETVIRLGPLSMPPLGAARLDDLTGSDAVTLFCERARESVAGFALTEANAGAVARICHRLDGIPLALELAAHRTRLLGAQQLADRLDDRFRLLAAGPRTVDARHRTLQSAIDWSYDLLSETEQTVLRRLGVFPSDFSLEAAEAVCAGAGEPPGPDAVELLDIVGRLVDKSLVIASPDEDAAEVRFRLSETVRDYAAHRLAEAGETGAMRVRHRDFFTATGDWFNFMSSERLRWSAAESDNVLAALERACEQGDTDTVARLAVPQALYWYFSGTPDAVGWLERAVTAPLLDEPFLRVQARVGLASVLTAVGGRRNVTRARVLLSEALTLALEGGDEIGAAWARLARAQATASAGRLQDSDALAREALAALPAAVAPSLGALGHLLRSTSFMAEGDLDGARHHGECALALVSNTDDYMLVQALGEMAVMEAAAGDAERAQRYADQAVGAARAIPGRRPLVMTLVRAAEAATISGRAEVARSHLDELLGVLRELGGPGWVAAALELTAIVLAPERPTTAATLLGSASGLRGSLREEGGILAMLSERLSACRAQIATKVGAAGAAERERTGAAMHLAEILAYARTELRSAMTAPSD